MSEPQEIMRIASKLAIEQVTQQLAMKAREFATTIPPEIGGRDALNAFADAIESTNAKAFGVGTRQ